MRTADSEGVAHGRTAMRTLFNAAQNHLKDEQETGSYRPELALRKLNPPRLTCV